MSENKQIYETRRKMVLISKMYPHLHHLAIIENEISKIDKQLAGKLEKLIKPLFDFHEKNVFKLHDEM